MINDKPLRKSEIDVYINTLNQHSLTNIETLTKLEKFISDYYISLPADLIDNIFQNIEKMQESINLSKEILIVLKETQDLTLIDLNFFDPYIASLVILKTTAHEYINNHKHNN